MTTPEPKLHLTEDPFIEAEQSDDPRIAADEQFIHGLLQFLHLDTRAEQERRIGAVMNEIRRGTVRGGSRVMIRASRRAVLAMAACVVLVATIAYLGIAPEQSAQAMVQATIEASKSAGPRRYEVRAAIPPRADQQMGDEADAEDFEPDLQRIALIDIQDSDHVLIRAITPRGHRLVVGRNEHGEWAVRPDGTIERFDAQRAWPRWIDFKGESILFESVDALVEQLKPNYALERLDAEPDAEQPARTFDRIVARKNAGPQHLPQVIALWINPDSRLVQRMELRWNIDEPRGGPNEMRPREMRDRRPQPQDGAASDDDSTNHAPRRPLLDRARRERAGEFRGQRGQFDREPPFPPRHPEQPDGADQFDRPEDDNMPPPRFLDGPPRFRDGGHRPPPRIVFRLIDTPEFEDGWFDPETHAPSASP